MLIEFEAERGKAGPVSGCARGCGGCPFASSCRPQTLEKEALVVSSKTPVSRIISMISSMIPSEIPSLVRKISETICNECRKEGVTACSHLGFQAT